jgi:hypothetical protein
MTDIEFADWLRSRPRELSPERVADVERERDTRRGEYVPHGGFAHHYRGEAQH